ncbi:MULTISPECIES: helix-turn-helix transcriptional regulator [unclassified Burkholderia]|uniref:helix-turn-helix domain-containing protein n=1 Tax=unclassified Burkholderia TaxID=2613784 RepID=UPI00076E4A7F|nr:MULTISPECIES: helix-turn-helix transcriptional regulator [unclassified Burkholderia]KWZ54948.1 XRE family transcriptional regulator [Burkholderia sp. MSMB1588]
MSARLIFAKRMKEVRISQGISQEKLAELCNLHRTYVSSVERGERNITVDNMERLAVALGVDIRELLTPNE